MVAVKKFVHRPGLLQLVHMGLQELWAPWQFHQLFPLLQKLLHRLLLVLHDPHDGCVLVNQFISGLSVPDDHI